MNEHVYTLRLWQDEDDNGSWRASLKDMKTKEVQYFHSLESFIQHLTTTIQSDQKADGKNNLEGNL